MWVTIQLRRWRDFMSDFTLPPGNPVLALLSRGTIKELASYSTVHGGLWWLWMPDLGRSTWDNISCSKGQNHMSQNCKFRSGSDQISYKKPQCVPKGALAFSLSALAVHHTVDSEGYESQIWPDQYDITFLAPKASTTYHKNRFQIWVWPNLA